MDSKVLSMLGLARRAGKLSMGHDMAKESLSKRKAKLIIFSCDVSKRLITSFENIISQGNYNTKYYKTTFSMEEIHFATGYKAGVLTVDDDNFAKRIEELINQEECIW